MSAFQNPSVQKWFKEKIQIVFYGSLKSLSNIFQSENGCQNNDNLLIVDTYLNDVFP